PSYERVDSQESMKAALAARPFDIVISDYVLPGFNAPDALKLLKTTGLDIPFFVVSGSIGEDLAVDLMNAGAHDYIMKGNLKRLVPSVVRQLHDAAARREHRIAEEKLRQSEERLRMAITAARMYTWDWDVKTGQLVRSGHYADV